MFKIRKSILITTVACSLFIVACSEKEHELSQEQMAHKKSMDYCFSTLVEAGAKWYQGDQAGTSCKQQNPTRPELERRKIMRLMEEKGLIPQNLPYLPSLIEGDCKVLAMRYDTLQEKAYAQNEGDEKVKTLSEAAVILANVKSGSCTLKTSAVPEDTPVKLEFEVQQDVKPG